MRCCSNRLRALLAALLCCPGAGAADAPLTRPTSHASIIAASEAAAGDSSLVLVIFGAEWCGPCRVLKKNVLASEDFLNRAGAVRMVEIDIDANQKAAREFDVEAVPTLVLMTADGKIVARQVGAFDADAFITWLNTGRERARQGQWAGTAPSARLNEFVTKAAADRLGPDDLQRLIAMLGENDPAERAASAKLIAAQREEAMPPLIAALTNSYLGVRIGASEILQRLAPASPAVDPWLSPEELVPASASISKWWSGVGKLPQAAESPRLDEAAKSSIGAALETLRGNDPVKRTDAMTTLVALGENALPAVRDAIKRSIKAGDHRTASLLEDVRWAILVPDSVEPRVNVRTALARGAGPERQAATARLARAGNNGIAALGELASDADPLVVEGAVRSLSKIGGKDAIPAMAALLKASDSNLRMTAAQALGQTKDADATKHLVSVVADPNEVVACAAIAGLEEIFSRENDNTKQPVPPEVSAALKRALVDPRWRVRATSAEMAGKLRISDLASDLRRLLADNDGFVVKNCLAALQLLGRPPKAAELTQTAKRLPAIRSDIVRLLAKSSDDDAVSLVSAMFNEGNANDRVALLAALGQHDRFDNSLLDQTWEPLLTNALSAADVSVRRATAALFGRMSSNVVVRVVEPALRDADVTVRADAAAAMLRMIAGGKSEAEMEQHLISADDEPIGAPSPRSAKTNQPFVTPQRAAAWHEALQKSANPAQEPLASAALFVTGDSKRDLPALVKAFSSIDTDTAQRLIKSSAIPQLVPKLPWPEAKPLVDALSKSPPLYAMAAAHSVNGAKELHAHFVEPMRFAAAVAPASGEDLSLVFNTMLSRATNQWSLARESESSRLVVRALLESTNAGWRALAVFLTGRGGDTNAITTLMKGAQDSEPWVRVAAMQGLARLANDRDALEQSLGKFVEDADEHVATFATLLLLEPELRNGAGMGWGVDGFHYGTYMQPFSGTYNENDDRPFVTLRSTPAYLAAAAQRASTNAYAGALPFVILLAQHGQFEQLGRAISQAPQPRGEQDAMMAHGILTAIALSRDAKYLPFVRAVADSVRADYELRALLRIIKGFTGAEARQLRLDINRRMRNASN